MKEKKNIDRIFQEKFKDFDVNPDEKVWENISKKLDEKDKKRPFIIPLWYKIGGVAAVIAIVIAGLLFTNSIQQDQKDPGVVFEKTEDLQEKEPNSNSTQSNTDKQEDENSLAAEENSSSKNESSSLTGADNSSSSNNSAAKKIPKSNKLKIQPKTNTKNEANSNSSRIASSEENLIKDNSKYEKEELANIPEVITKDPSGGIAENDSIKSENIIQEPEKIKGEENALAQVEKEKQGSEKEEEETSESNSKKLSLSTFAAPVFYKNIGSGNELSSQFANNSASSDVTVSYGVKLAYEVSDKVKIRMGISKINMSYNIQDISYSPMAMASSFENIRPTSDNLNIRSNGNLENSFSENSSAATSLTTSIFTPGEINQQFGFIEIPIEIEYSLMDKKLGLNLIGGASGLFLDKNRVDLNSGNNTTQIGEASNINSTSFSTNIGVGLDYELSDKFSLNLEPIFKYQLNTFNNVQNVQPVNFGIYSGISIKF